MTPLSLPRISALHSRRAVRDGLASPPSLPGALSRVRSRASGMLGRRLPAALALPVAMSVAPLAIAAPELSAASDDTATVLYLRNTGTESVPLEVRVGLAAECEENDLLIRAVLPPGGVWRLGGETPVCWRELVARGSTGTLLSAGGWSRRALARGARADVVLTGPAGAGSGSGDDGALAGS